MMEKALEYLKNTKLLLSTVIALFTFAFTAYEGYKEIKADIAKNTKLIEISQMQQLAPIVRASEKNPCSVTDREWEEYEINYSTLFSLKVKYNRISPQAFNMMKRLDKDLSTCVR